MWDSFAFELIDEVELLSVLPACEIFFSRNLSRLDFVALYCQTKKTIPYGSEKSLLLEVGQKRSEWSVTSQTVTQLSFHCTCVSLHFSKRHPRVWIELRFKGFYHSRIWFLNQSFLLENTCSPSALVASKLNQIQLLFFVSWKKC